MDIQYNRVNNDTLNTTKVRNYSWYIKKGIIYLFLFLFLCF